MIYFALLVVCIALIIFSGYKQYKKSNRRQLYRPRHQHRMSSK